MDQLKKIDQGGYPGERLASIQGVTLIELLIIIAIVAVLSVGGLAFFYALSSESNTTGGEILKEAVRQFTVQALSNEGAEMTWNGKRQLSIVSLGSNPVTKNYLMPNNIQIDLNGKPFSCLVLNPRGFPDNGVMSCNGGLNPTTPLTWSMSDGNSQFTFQ
ncbi:hypothetical protein HF673_00015 [Acidithiobacillus thiooxidans]|jgi:hypothetical protein|uniref:hypothetical protein n=1 Tax=Acidithiobacillus thiooxidans TaxID=930 RepID=UPI001C06F173|nr:hypothetical protein [Acidithiobacillus thiooxidans]MBU2834202.1 hypothetical protein [Acidithiobacillus thiooxidans]